jgi:hypothetical protein
MLGDGGKDSTEFTYYINLYYLFPKHLSIISIYIYI